MTSPDIAALRLAALKYHSDVPAGKLALAATKPLTNPRDLALAYTPGVAAPCEEIVLDPDAAYRYTARGNLVGVVTNGTAVLGLGDVGALASKPVMEGKAVLFKKFAGIDCFDIEIDEKDPGRLVEVIAALEPTFGAINLEDIKAPECFFVERELRKRMRIPVFHDDQHGTAITVAAALVSALAVVGKNISEVRLVTSGAGAAALACLKLLVRLGLKKENVVATDLAGVVYVGRTELMDDEKAEFAQTTNMRSLKEAIVGADVFLGLSAANVLKTDMLAAMAPNPIVFALANPNPEIRPELAHSVRDDIVIATGRSDYPNQVNNLLCFPFIFRGALDCGATAITDEMEIAAVHAISALARAEQNEVVAAAYAGEPLSFSRDYLIPKPFDPRLMLMVAPAVAAAAAASGVARRPITDLDGYREKLKSQVFASGNMMRPIFAAAKASSNRRVCYSEGEEERVLRAVQILIDEGIARPTLVGRPDIISRRIVQFGLRLRQDRDYDVVNVEKDDRYRDFWQTYHGMTARKGVTVALAKIEMRRRLSLIGTMLLHKGQVDGLICGTWGNLEHHLPYIDQVIGKKPGVSTYAAMNALVLSDRQVFLADTHVNHNPTPEQIADIAVMAAESMLGLGIKPVAALLSHSQFGSSNQPSAEKMRRTLELLRERAPWLAVDGEMHGDFALDPRMRQSGDSCVLESAANLLIFPSIDAANISYALLKAAAGGNIAIGSILLGVAKPVHLLTPDSTVRRIVNMSALLVANKINEH